MGGRSHGPAHSLHMQSSFRGGGQPSGQDRKHFPCAAKRRSLGTAGSNSCFFFEYIYLAARVLSLWHVGSSSLTRDGSRGSCNGSPEPLDHQGSHLFWRREGGLTTDSLPRSPTFQVGEVAKEAMETLQPLSAFLLRMRDAQRVGGLPKGNMARVKERRGEGAGAGGRSEVRLWACSSDGGHASSGLPRSELH